MKEETELQKIGARLKQIRIEAGYSSHEKFAIENGFSRMQYWRMEEVKANMTMRSLIAVLNVHKVSFVDFF